MFKREFIAIAVATSFPLIGVAVAALATAVGAVAHRGHAH